MGSRDRSRLEDAVLKERGERFEHDGRCRRITLARVHPELPAFIVIEVQKIEADAAVAGRRHFELPAAMREAPQCRLEKRPGHSVKDDLRSLPLVRLIELAEALTHAGRIAEGLSVVEAGIVQSEVGWLTPKLLCLTEGFGTADLIKAKQLLGELGDAGGR
jgi:hypothetical protein